MTAKALEKISGTPHQKALEYKRKQRKNLEEAGRAQAAESANAEKHKKRGRKNNEIYNHLQERKT